MAQSKRTREPGVEAFRLLLTIPVILAHAWTFKGDQSVGALHYLPLMLGHIAVPFFFIASGTLLRWQEGQPLAVVRWSWYKLAPLFAFWMSLYIVAAWFAGRGTFLQLVASIPLGGPTRHLWFLPALGFALSLVAVSLRLLGWRRTWIITIALAGTGLLIGGYLSFWGYGTRWLRVAYLTAPLFVMIGVALKDLPPLGRPVWLGLAALGCYALQVADDLWLSTSAGYRLTEHPTVTLATIPFALVVFLWARELSSGTVVNGLASLGRFGLIIYCLHPLFLMVLLNAIPYRSYGMTFAMTLAALALSIAAGSIIQQVKKRGARPKQTRALIAQP